MHRFIGTLAALSVLNSLVSNSLSAADAPHPFLEYVRQQAADWRGADKPPASLAEWEARRETIRSKMLNAWGGFPASPCPLEPKILGTLQREEYRIEKVLFQTLPGVWMTANAYVPDRPGRLPAVVGVHGHWPKAKQDAVPQTRYIGLARLGFFVLALDALGAGERGVGKALGEYHGEMVAATLWPVGLPLSGLQVYENMRAVDYLLTRPEVDGKRIGITGASGGGNQTMYAGAWDDRFAAVVPVCSVGNYQAYLGAACCMCEVVPGALQFMEESSILSLTAPRALMVFNATRDGIQFSILEAEKSLAATAPVYRLYGHPDHLRHVTFEAPHSYNQSMRETMYGWMTLHLKGEGDGSPIAEQPITTEDPETLRCFPGDSRPDDFVTIPRFAAREGRKLLARIAAPRDAAGWRSQRESMRAGLTQCLYGEKPVPTAKQVPASVTGSEGERTVQFQPEPGIAISARQAPFASPKQKTAILLDLDQGAKAAEGETARGLRAAGWSVIVFDLRASGALAYDRDRIGRAPDHNTAEWSLWLGRPLLGQWVIDIRRLLDAMAQHDGGLPPDVRLVGEGPAGLVALCAAALDDRITEVVATGSLASYISEVPYEGQRLGVMAPAVLRECGDVPHIAALLAPRMLTVSGGVTGGGEPLDGEGLRRGFEFTRNVYRLENAEGQLTIEAPPATRP
ncbi:MAG: prolyl oligopeptidase family serine peptidase [Rhodopirellula sp.]|nr:prolyl oligopeptidase family serine peptidase [Rhodopirellula sp.]